MREKFLVVILIITAATADIFPGASAQDAAAKAQQLIAQARAALGGDKLKSLSVTGNYRRTFGQMEMTGEVSYDLLLPDMMRQGVRSDFARLVIGWLLTTPSSFPVEYSFAGEAESPDGKADALDVKGPGGFAIRLFLDQKTHRPLMLTYNARKPRIMTQTAAPGAPRNPEEMEKRMKEMEAETAKQPEVEFRIYLSDYREVNGVSIPHKMTRSIEDEVNEELEIKNVKINPQLKPEKFVKKWIH